MQRIVLILPDENKRLPRAETLRRKGFLVSTALDPDDGEDEEKRAERARRAETDQEGAP